MNIKQSQNITIFSLNSLNLSLVYQKKTTFIIHLINTHLHISSPVGLKLLLIIHIDLLPGTRRSSLHPPMNDKRQGESRRIQHYIPFSCSFSFSTRMLSAAGAHSGLIHHGAGDRTARLWARLRWLP